MSTQALPRTQRYARSRQLFETAQNYLPGGNSRLTIHLNPHPVYIQEGHGCRLVDVDGNEYIDLINNYTSLIHGHANPEIQAAAIAALRRGTAYAAPTEPEIELARLLTERLPAVEQVRFVNSGTEAVMNAVKAARAYTGKAAIAKFEGAYHGAYDYVEVSLSSGPDNWGDPDQPAATRYCKGAPQGVLDDVVVLPFNHTAETVALIRRHRDRLAAVVLDVMPSRVGCIPPDPDFLQAVQAECKALGILFILDEVIALRLGYHGAQGVYGLDPDLTTMGKIIGGGFAVGAVGGKRAVMSVFDATQGKPDLPHGGTFNANPVTMAAGLKAMELMTSAAFERLNALGEQLRRDVAAAIKRLNVPWQVTGAGSLFRLHPKASTLVDLRSAHQTPAEEAKVSALHWGLLDRGIFLGSALFGCVSTAMGVSEVAALVTKVSEALQEVEG